MTEEIKQRLTNANVTRTECLFAPRHETAEGKLEIKSNVDYLPISPAFKNLYLISSPVSQLDKQPKEGRKGNIHENRIISEPFLYKFYHICLQICLIFSLHQQLPTDWERLCNAQDSPKKINASPDGWAAWGVVMSTRWCLLVDHCVPRNWDRILVSAVKRLISQAGMVSIWPLLWQRDVKLQQTNWTMGSTDPSIQMFINDEITDICIKIHHTTWKVGDISIRSILPLRERFISQKNKQESMGEWQTGTERKSMLDNNIFDIDL